MKLFLIIMLIFCAALGAVAAPKDAGYYNETESTARIPYVTLPTGIEKQISISSSHKDIYLDLVSEGKFVESSYKDLRLRMGTQFGSLDTKLQLSFMEALSKKFIDNGLTVTPSKDFLEKVWVSWEAYTIDGSEDAWIAFTLQVGKSNATPLGVFILPYRANLSILDSQKLDQVEFISLNTAFLYNTVLEVVSFENGNFAMNLLHSNDVGPGLLNLYVSFATTKSGFQHPNRPFHRQTEDQFHWTGGAQYIQGRLSITLEGGYTALEQNDEKFLVFQIAYDIPDSSMAIYATLEVLESIYKDESGTSIAIGARWKILENVSFFMEGVEIRPEDRKLHYEFLTGILIEGHAKKMEEK